ncbi:hypothetical protein JKP88DRAFT_261429 [Tribonema minus]|uniref:Uncharacterized protein n=1 Tax=Tribonema minus TaxID=303371 RepID=A0A836CA20_9STRA|nr:hypothetical protein JKP88DRAFT_261429 [Tribonema minus]
MDADRFMECQLWLHPMSLDHWPPTRVRTSTGEDDDAEACTTVAVLDSALLSIHNRVDANAPSAPVQTPAIVLSRASRKRKRDLDESQEPQEACALDFDAALLLDPRACAGLYFRIDGRVYFVDHTQIESIACPVPAPEGVLPDSGSGAAAAADATVAVLTFPNVLVCWWPQAAPRAEAVAKLQAAVKAISANLTPALSHPLAAAAAAAAAPSDLAAAAARAAAAACDALPAAALRAAQPRAHVAALAALPRAAVLGLARAQGAAGGADALFAGEWRGLAARGGLAAAARAWSGALLPAPRRRAIDARLAAEQERAAEALEALLGEVWGGGGAGGGGKGGGGAADAALRLDRLVARLHGVREDRLLLALLPHAT